MLAGRGRKIDAVIELKVDDEAMVGRMESRVRENPGAARADDNPETLRKRLSVYRQNTAPLLDFYRGQGKLVTVDGMAPDRRGLGRDEAGHGPVRARPPDPLFRQGFWDP